MATQNHTEILQIVTAAVEAQVTPRWWYLNVEDLSPEGRHFANVYDTMHRFMHAIEAFGAAVESWDSAASASLDSLGLAIQEHAAEARQFLDVMWSAHVVAEGGVGIEVEGSDDELVPSADLEDLAQRFMHISYDHLPAPKLLAIQAAFRSALHRDYQGVATAIDRMSALAVDGNTQRPVADQAVEVLDEGFAPAVLTPGNDYRPIAGMPKGLAERFYALMEDRLPPRLAGHFTAILDAALQRDFDGLEKAIGGVEQRLNLALGGLPA